MGDLECPYCGHFYRPRTDDGNLCEEETTYHEECPKCEKVFVAMVSWLPTYSASKADCLNGGEHTLAESKICPKPSRPRIYCTTCGEVAQEPLWKEGVND